MNFFKKFLLIPFPIINNLNLKFVLSFNSLKDSNIVIIKCGYYHSYCKTNNKSHYLWGLNQYNECITNDGREEIREPFCINNNVHFEIADVFLGWWNTKLFSSFSILKKSELS